MNPVTVTLSNVAGGTRSTVIAPDWRMNPFAVSVYVVASGTVNYTVQDTPDDFPNVVPSNWFSHPTLVTLTASANGNYAFPTRGISIVVNSGTGSVTMTIIQGAGIF